MMDLCPSGLALLDRMHRKAARLLLDFSPRSPKPCNLVELGWRPLSLELCGERARLLSRLLRSNNEHILCLLDASGAELGSWAQSAALAFKPWCPLGLPSAKCEWRAALQAWSRDTWAMAAEDALWECRSHPGLANYMHPCLCLEGRLRVDPFLHSSSMRPEAACRFARFMAGGQVLRAGDPIAVPDASPSNCCVLCLERGICCPETLRHVVFDCPDYEAIWFGSGLAELLAEHRLTCSCNIVIDGLGK